MNWLVIMFWASVGLFITVGIYWLGYSDGRMSGWVDGYCNRPLKGKETK